MHCVAAHSIISTACVLACLNIPLSLTCVKSLCVFGFAFCTLFVSCIVLNLSSPVKHVWFSYLSLLLHVVLLSLGPSVVCRLQYLSGEGAVQVTGRAELDLSHTYAHIQILRACWHLAEGLSRIGGICWSIV